MDAAGLNMISGSGLSKLKRLLCITMICFTWGNIKIKIPHLYSGRNAMVAEMHLQTRTSVKFSVCRGNPERILQL